MDYVEDCIENGDAEVANAITREIIYIGEEEPGEGEHSSNTGNNFVGNSNAVESSPLCEDSESVIEGWDMLRVGSATSGASYKVVYSNQKKSI